MIVCRDALAADSFATAFANRILDLSDLQPVVETACNRPDILGAIAVKGGQMAVGGAFELRLFETRPPH